MRLLGLCILHGMCLFAILFLYQIGWSSTTEDEAPLRPNTTESSVVDEARLWSGLIVHLGCGDGRLTGAFGAERGRVVQGLDSKQRNVDLARAHIRSLGLYGKVSVRRLDDHRLPYIDGLVNFLVVSDSLSVDKRELLRVLSPGGVAVILATDSETQVVNRLVKPWPEETDQWTHYLYDASGNAVSRDRRVGPPRHLQWQADPRWARSHEHTASVTTLVAGEGKIFYIEDQGIPGTFVADLPERWALMARDAFSGVLLWKKEFTDWGNPVWGGVWHIREPMTIPRRLVVGGGKLYATLGFRQAAIAVLDPDTGEILDSYQEGKNNDEFIWHDGVLLVRQRKSIPDYPLRRGSSAAIVAARRGEAPDIPPASPGDETLLALDTETGRQLWEHEEQRIVSLSLAAHADRVVYHNLDEIVCLDLRSGKERWRAECSAWPDVIGTAGTLVMYGEKVVHAGDQGIRVFSGSTGELLWQGPRLWRMSVRHPPDLFVIDGLIWGGPTPPIAGGTSYADRHQTPTAVPHVEGERLQAWDLATGKVARELDLGNLITPGHHVRCYRSKATSRFLIWPKRGMDFIDIEQRANHERADWVRGECSYGVMPSGGLIYAPPHPCICYLGVLLHGFNALAPAGAEAVESLPASTRQQPRLFPGPAYGRKNVAPAVHELRSHADWPTFRHDASRSGFSPHAVSASLRKKWTSNIGGRLTQPVIAEGTVYVASMDTHTLHAVQAATGRGRWRFTADARIDSPPTIHDGLVLVGSNDGRVYCLDADDGQLVWRFQAAPAEAQCVVREQVESRWPVHGSILVQNGVAYFCAGRSSFLDGGIYLYGLDPRTGKVLHETHLDGPWPEPSTDRSEPYGMEGAKSDVLTGDGEHVFLGFNEFDLELNPQSGRPLASDGSRNVRLRLMATTGLLDDTWWDRGRWTYSTRWPGRNWDHNAPYTGQILSFDAEAVYALNAFPSAGGMSPRFDPGKQGYLLVAHDHAGDAGEASAVVRWRRYVPIRSRGMVLTGDILFLAGAPDVIPDDDPYAAFEGRAGALLWAVDTADGTTLSEFELANSPVFDGLVAAGDSLYVSTDDGCLIRLVPADSRITD